MTRPIPTVLILATALALAAPASAQDLGERFPGLLPEAGSPDDIPLPPSLEAEDEAEADIADTPEARMDRLFGRLREAPTEQRAAAIARTIQREFLDSGSPTIALLMKQAASAVEAKQLPVALDLLDAVVRLKPDYAEGWNRRATVHFMREDFGRSMADLERALAIEPRNWEAIGGLATILNALDQKDEAREACEQALAIYPLQPRIKDACDDLEAERDGEDI